MNLIHCRRRRRLRHHHLETITHTTPNEEPVDPDLHTYRDQNNGSNDWRNKKINYDL
jgi:hypothetical protein